MSFNNFIGLCLYQFVSLWQEYKRTPKQLFFGYLLCDLCKIKSVHKKSRLIFFLAVSLEMLQLKFKKRIVSSNIL